MKQEVYMNRELSWLKFNERVLEEAENELVPLAGSPSRQTRAVFRKENSAAITGV